MKMTRREAVRRTVLAGSSLVAISALAQNPPPPPATTSGTGPFTLPPLPYPLDALEPHIDAKTMEIHHGKHHAAYVTNLNKAVADKPAGKKSVDELVRKLGDLPDGIRMAVRNNGGGHLNHTLFWQMMKKGGGGQPKGELASAIDKKFGSFSKFQEEFTRTATTVFGSGWAWLTLDENKQLKLEQTSNQDSPITQGRIPLLGLDVWEHAYYLKYQNRRPEYITAFYNVINWDFVTERFRSHSK